jgi:hypothetical protein
MITRVSFASILAVCAVACRSPKQIDVFDIMTAAPVCDSTQAEANPSEPGPMLPAVVRSVTDYAMVVGTAEEAASRHPFNASPIDLYPADTLNAASRTRLRTGTDKFGGFVFDSVPPGIYVIRGRFIAHQPAEQRVTVRAGSIDTVRLSLRRYVCYGY